MRQHTIDENKQTLEFTDALDDQKDSEHREHGVSDEVTEKAEAEAQKILRACATKSIKA